MDLQLSDDQKLIKNSAEKFIRENYTFEYRNKFLNSNLSVNKEVWSEFSSLGWLGLPFEEEYGGFGGDAVDISVIMQSFGEGLVLEPYLSSILMGGKCIEALGNKKQKEYYLKALIDGEIFLSFAYIEPKSRYDLSYVSTLAKKNNNGWVINGRKSLVLGAENSDYIVTTARVEGNVNDKKGIKLFIIPRDSKGLTFRNYRTVDGFKASDLTFSDTVISKQYELEYNSQNFNCIEKIIDFATIAICNECVGVMSSMYDQTLKYIKTREQFGRKIGQFQVIQHKAVEMFIKTEEMKSLACMINLNFQKDEYTRKKAISSAKIYVGTSGRNFGEEAIQLHGGMGVTQEMAISHYFKRLTAIDLSFGNADYHFDRFDEII